MRVKGLDIETQANELAQAVLTGQFQVEELPQKAREAVIPRIKKIKEQTAKAKAEADRKKTIAEKKAAMSKKAKAKTVIKTKG